MKLKDILEINKNLIQLKELNKLFDFELGQKLLHNLVYSNKIIDEQNKIFSNIVIESGNFDGYEYVLPADKMNMYDDMLESEIEFSEFKYILNSELTKNNKFDLTTIELLNPLIY